MITAGLVILLFVAYELWFTGFEAARAQAKLRKEPLPPLPASGPGHIAFGHALGVIFIPRLGASYHKVIVQGVSTADLQKGGPGHVPTTALPGQLGNSVLSGHRTTYGAPFNRLDEVRSGDAVVIETRTTWLVFREVRTVVVSPDASWVTLPVPGHPAATPTKSLLTLTTCHPKYSAAHRLVVFATLESQQPRSAGLPAALTATG
jgi:sortase A